MVSMKRKPFVIVDSPMAIFVFICMLLLPGGASTAATKYNVIYTFQGGSDGSTPDAPLIADPNGNLYGSTSQGGNVSKSSNCYPLGCGTVFELTTKGGVWKKAILYSFNLTNGSSPALSPLVFDKSGNLFGTTLSGGSGNYGVVFELMPPKNKGGQWTEKSIYNFTGRKDGAVPNGVIFDSAGNLFGSTQSGGQYGQQGAGTVFELTQKGGVWSETTLYSFQMIGDGNNAGLVVFDSHGNLFGTTRGIDVSCNPKDPVQCGGVFELEAPSQQGGAWTYKQIHSFQGYNDGSFPSFGGLIFDSTGNLYGMTVGTGGTGNIPNENAEGTIFKLEPPAQQGDPWKETLLHSFPRPGGIDGSGPQGGVIFDPSGNLYGTTLYGAGNGKVCAYRGCGSAFQLSPPTKGDAWKETQLHAFVAGNDGSGPSSALLFQKKMLFGVTAFGGNTGCEGSGCGTIFEVGP
jgi:hypothetical protein